MTRYLMHFSCWEKIGKPNVNESGISRPLACCAVCGIQGVTGGVFINESHMPKKILNKLDEERERYWNIRCP